MRKKNNLNKFGHVTKTKKERSNYVEQVNGTTGDVYDNEDFEETLSKEELSGSPEEVEPVKKPYKSLKTWWEENSKTVIISGILIPFFLWFFFSFIGYGKDLSVLETNFNNIEDDVVELKGKYDSLNDKSIKAEVLLDEIRKDIDSLNNKFIN